VVPQVQPFARAKPVGSTQRKSQKYTRYAPKGLRAEHRQGDGNRVASSSVNEEHSGMCAPRITRKLALPLLVSLVVLCGCAHHYLMKLSDGDQTISVSKPILQGTNYLFTGTDGVGYMVPRSRVVKIKTISADDQEKRPLSPPKPHRPKHWYFLWLA
jgi:hypothetical protein